MHQHDIRNCRNSYRLIVLTSTGYFRQRLSDESMSPDIVFLEMFLSLAIMNSLHFYLRKDIYVIKMFLIGLVTT